MDINASRTTYHANVNLPSGVPFAANKEYKVNINGTDYSFKTDSTGNLVLKGLENGINTIKFTANGIEYNSSFKIDHSDISILANITESDNDEDHTSELFNPNKIYFQVGADKNDKISFLIENMDCKGIGIANTSIGSQELALQTLDNIKLAIDMVSKQRGNLGSIQNRLEHTQAYININSENLSKSESRIRDTDMAKSMIAYAKESIINKSAQAILTQANQTPKMVLELLN